MLSDGALEVELEKPLAEIIAAKDVLGAIGPQGRGKPSCKGKYI